jgi:hypothetical protein
MSGGSIFPDSSPPSEVFVSNGLSFRVDGDDNVTVVSLSMPFELGVFVALNGRSYRIWRFNIDDVTGSLRLIKIPPSVEIISSGSFADLRELEEVIFEENGSLRELAGFAGCGIRS